jgi:hydrogenase maturation factor
VHVGFAIAKVDPEQAARAYETLQELGLLQDLTSDLEDAPERPS